MTQVLAGGDLAAVLVAAVGTIVILAIVRATFGRRARIANEMIGLDLSEHGEEAYFGGEARWRKA